MNPNEFAPHLQTTLVPVVDGQKRGWKVFINGELVETEIKTLDLVNTRYGRVSYGDDLSHEYDGVCIHEPGGGGQQILPYSIIQDKLFVGVIPEWRRNLGAVTLNAPRGYKDPGLSHIESAAIEAQQEVGVLVENRLSRLEGEPVNCNSALFITFGEEGFDFFAFEVPEEDLMRDNENNNIIFKNAGEPVQGAGEKIYKCRFIPWHEAMNLKDNFTIAGVGRLIRQFILQGRAALLV